MGVGRSFLRTAPAVSLVLFTAQAALAAASPPSVLIPSTRADQTPVAPSYRQPALETRMQAAASPSSFAPFRLTDVEVHGSTLPSAILRPAYAPWLGRTVDQNDLKTIVAALSQIYATRSDIALYGVTLSAQSFQGGRMRVDVVEGFIQGARVTARGGGKRNNRLLSRYLGRLMAERPLRRSTLERYTALIRDIAGLNPSLEFAAGTKPGGFVLVVNTASRSAEIGLGVNNRGTAFLGRTQIDADLALHSLFRQGDDTHVTVAVPTELSRFQYYGVSHAEPLGTTGASITGTVGYLKTRPSFADLHGHAVTLGLSAIAPVLRRNAQSLYLTAGLDGINSSNALLGDEISDDHVRTARLGASYVRQNPRYFLLLNGSANFGLDALGAHVISPEVSDLRFTKYTAKLSANIALPSDMVLRLDSAGQYSADRLPGSEQLALGGEEFGRAYEAAIVAGDEGVAGSAELAWKVARIAPPALRASELYAFADGGSTRRFTRPSEPGATQQLASIGGGVRLAVTSRAVFQLEAARGLLNPLPTEDHESWRAIFSVRTAF